MRAKCAQMRAKGAQMTGKGAKMTTHRRYCGAGEKEVGPGMGLAQILRRRFYQEAHEVHEGRGRNI